MIREIPFYKQQTKFDCGIASTLNAIDYLRPQERFSREDIISEIDNHDKNSGIYSIALALAIRKLGFEVNHIQFSSKKHIEVEEENENKIIRLSREFSNLGGKVTDKRISTNDICDRFDDGEIPIILLNAKILRDAKGFIGHYCTFVGYTEHSVSLHNPRRKPNTLVNKKKFNSARMYHGTFENVLFVSN